MGQRHQTFLITHNAYKTVKDKLNLQPGNRASEETEVKDKSFENLLFGFDNTLNIHTLESAFGTAAETVLAYHNQWLYGRNAVGMVYDLLQFTSHIKPIYNPFVPGYYRYRFGGKLEDLALQLEVAHSLLSIRNQNNLTEQIPIDIGHFRFNLLNLTHPQVREKFDAHMNDDGISIIDMVRGKYCFILLNTDQDPMYIFKLGEHNEPYLPISAASYAEMYYPSEKSALEATQIEDKTEAEIEKMLHANLLHNNTINAFFEPFDVLTVDELAAFFPKMYLHRHQTDPNVANEKPPGSAR